MKNKFLVACLVSLLSVTSIYAYTGPKTEGAGYAAVIRDFIDSHMNGNYKELNKILDENYTLKIPRGNKVILQNKSSLVEAMKKEAGTQQNCQSNYEVLAKSDALVIARVDFSYHDSIQHNYLTLERDDDNNWKITQVCKMFEDLQTTTPTGTTGDVTAKN
ncbi:nuclear transport factor 2 family protein [Mucilaginibacter sp. SG564]|uniref:nuclear transport factor 2 family protein n=1 Tax=unclassified Mucilaginibacter TaxID=2617802 RepID=UPI001551F9E4|nr:nuclear transport factor 2 family protein [Mucilaginibacter sp. SG564]NOW97377.1 hypothetical protein [Mucilaginibacter sp. SG564]